MHSLNPDKDSESSHCSYPAVGCSDLIVLTAYRAGRERKLNFGDSRSIPLWSPQPGNNSDIIHYYYPDLGCKGIIFCCDTAQSWVVVMNMPWRKVARVLARVRE